MCGLLKTKTKEEEKAKSAANPISTIARMMRARSIMAKVGRNGGGDKQHTSIFLCVL